MSFTLVEAVDHVWSTLCTQHDVDTESPALECLLCGVDVSDAQRAARGVMVNAILELMASIGRFSPWYTKPAAAFGLTIRRRPSGQCLGWGLTDAAEERYCGLLSELASGIETERALAEAIHYITELSEAAVARDWSNPEGNGDGT